MPSPDRCIVVLGTGGTIAGQGSSPDARSYRAAQIAVSRLVAAVPALAGERLESEQVAQIDSKDMSYAVWQALAGRIDHHLARPDVAGVVVTHGTDTLEETAYFLHRVLSAGKPVVLTAAMRPATAFDADGPANLVDAVATARSSLVRGVVVVMAGRVHRAVDVRKHHSHRIDAFSSGDAGPWAELVDAGAVTADAAPGARVARRALRVLRAVDDAPPPLGLARIAIDPAQWPRVDWVTSHAGADGRIVDALVDRGVEGLLVAGTGHGTVHAGLDAALRRAAERGVTVWRASRCDEGGIADTSAEAWPSAGPLPPAKARIDLLLMLLASR